MILGLSAAEFKHLSDVLTLSDSLWEDAWKNALYYAVWCMPWLIAGWNIIYHWFYIENFGFRYFPIVPYIPYKLGEFARLLGPPMNPLIMYFYNYFGWAIVLFLVGFGCTTGYMKFFGEMLEII